MYRCEFIKYKKGRCRGAAKRGHRLCGPHLSKVKSPKWAARKWVLGYGGEDPLLLRLQSRAKEHPGWTPSYKEMYQMQQAAGYLVEFASL